MHVFELFIHEPFHSSQPTPRRVEVVVEGRYLADILKEQQITSGYCEVQGVRIPVDLWDKLVPAKGAQIHVYPDVGTKDFSTSFLQHLNATHSVGGLFVYCVDVTEDPVGPVVRRFTTYTEPISFLSNTYNPLFMLMSGYEDSMSMELPRMTLSVPEAHDQIIQMAESIDIRENDVVIYLVHLRDYKNPMEGSDEHDKIHFQVQSVTSDSGLVVFNLGWNISLDDPLPREVLEHSKHPGIPTDTQRIFI